LNRTKHNKTLKKPGKTKAFFICLLIASFLWIIHALNTVYTQNFKVPVVFKNIPQNKKALEPLPEKISIDVKASGLKLSFLMLKSPFAPLELDFNNLKSVHHNQCYVLSSSKLNFRSIFNIEAQIKHISPDSLYFSENTGLQKSVPVKVPLTVQCQEGYGFLNPLTIPSEIQIWGDSTSIKQIDTIFTAPLNLINLKENITKSIAVIKPNEKMYSNVSEIKLEIVVSKLIERSVIIPINTINETQKNKVNIFPSSVKVTFTTLQNNFNLSDTFAFKALIDLKKSSSRSKKYSVFLVNKPSQTTVMSIEPKEVEVLIFK
jgi:YbbR domain-containing protein